MLERKNESLYLITFLIIAMLLGFITTYFLELPRVLTYCIIATVLSLLIYCMILVLYHFYKKHTTQDVYRGYLARGRYVEVASRIDNDSKEMNDVWEFKLLALFHSGNIIGFMHLYHNYMNEINECASLQRYQICLLHDLLLAIESHHKPVRFLKNMENTKRKYTKCIEYQLYTNIYLGLKEYYKPQRNLVKVYFEKFLQQSEEVSKPLSFYLYYLITLTMFENNHPLCESYANRTQSFIFDENSLQLVNTHIHPRMNSMQKGSGYQKDMDRQKDKTDFLNDIDLNSPFDPSYDMEETGFRTSPQTQEGFVKKRNLNDFQSDFDALNASVQNGNSYNLYEDNEFDEILPRQRQQYFQQPSPTMMEDDMNMDLDPTWFARSSIHNDEALVTANYSKRNPRMQEPMRQRQEPIGSTYRGDPIQQEQDIFMRTPTYQDAPIPPAYEASVPLPAREEPAFMNTRTYMDKQLEQRPQRSRQVTMQTSNTMSHQDIQDRQEMNQQQMQQRFPNQMNQQMRNNIQQPTQAPQMQNQRMQEQRIQNASAIKQDMENTPQDRFARFQQPSTPHPKMSELAQQSETISRVNEKKKLFRKENTHTNQEHADFDNPNAIGKKPFLQETAKPKTRLPQAPKHNVVQNLPKNEQLETTSLSFYRTYVKRNVAIAGMTLLNAIAVSIASSNIVYTQFFNRYPINSSVIMDMVFLSSMVALVMTYLITGIHTGWTILKKPIANWSMVVKCLTSPFLFMASLLIGAVAQIPYLIYATIKSKLL